MTTLSALCIYPIKSCGGISLQEADISEFGFALDRRWMLIDRNGHFLSQREYPVMATVRTALQGDELIVRAPGMPVLHLPLQADAAAGKIAVTIWTDSAQAFDCGEEAHRWFSSCFGADVRLVRFDPEAQRVCSRRWTGGVTATTQFSDGFQILVASEASLQDLNRRLQAKGAPALPMDRFRPNVVLSGLDAYEEDYVDTLTFAADGSGREIVIKLVKPCARCPIPGIDQVTGLRDPTWPDEPLDTLATYRANERVDGGLTFGQNAVVLHGSGSALRVGQAVRCELLF